MSDSIEALRAGRIILAVADEDQRQLIETMYETMSEESGIVGLVVALASVSIEFAKADAGDDWRAVMSRALNVIDLDGTGVGVESDAAVEDGDGSEHW